LGEAKLVVWELLSRIHGDGGGKEDIAERDGSGMGVAAIGEE